VPDLNEREGDIRLLVVHFMEEVCSKMGKPPLAIAEEAFVRLEKYRWTGNVRELRNVIERLAILCDKEVTDADVEKYVHPLNQMEGARHRV
jgi:DNA-binding NtrC family response regulator